MSKLDENGKPIYSENGKVLKVQTILSLICQIFYFKILIEKIFMLTKKFNILFFLILILFFILFKNTDFFKNTYNIINKNHDIRQQTANDFCGLLGSGYIFYIKEKFKLKKSPIIYINNTARPVNINQNWIFPNNNKSIDESKVIIINFSKKLTLN